MALRALMIKKDLDTARKTMDSLREKEAELQKREAELETAVNEIETEDEKAAVEEEVSKFEKENEDLKNEISELEGKISELEKNLEDEEAKNDSKAEEVIEEETKETIEDKRSLNTKMEVRDNKAIFEREDVKAFLTEVRTAIAEKRAITNVGLTIPEVMLPMIEDNLANESKLLSLVNSQKVKGQGRAIVQGDVSEAVWTEMCKNINELTLVFNDVELDGYMCAGYMAICNAVLEDNDVDLAGKLVKAISRALAKAIDKAIVYGEGTRMPLGIVTRLAQTSQPSGYPATARTWVDLHTSNIKTGTGATGVALIQEIVSNSACADNDYAENLVWLMNHKTHVAVQSATLAANAAGVIVPGVEDTMPVVGGKIIELPFIPDNNIVFGYMDAYVLLERGAIRIQNSEHAMFTADKTVFKGVGRFDGTPAIAEAFGVMTITNTSPTTEVTFAADEANPS